MNTMRKIFVEKIISFVLAVAAMPAFYCGHLNAQTREEYVEGFVQRMYELVLGRDADPIGLEYWTGQLLSGEQTGASVALGFFGSDEYEEADKSNEDYVNDLYQVMLGREADPTGLLYWSDRLGDGTPRTFVLGGFVASDEFGSICDSYGIARGSIPSNMYEFISLVPGGNDLALLGGFNPSEGALDSLCSAMAALNARCEYGFLLIDISTGEGIAYNIDRRFYGASTIKGPFVASLACYVPDQVPALQNLMTNTVIYSDNDAYDTLNHTYGAQYLRQWAMECGVDPARVSHRYAAFTVRELGELWYRNYEFFESGEYGRQIGSWYETPNYSLIHEALGDLYVTRSKGGWYAMEGRPELSAAADAGIVYSDNGPYLVVVMSNNPGSFTSLMPLMQALDDVHSLM